MKSCGILTKMQTAITPSGSVSYQLYLGKDKVDLNALVGRDLHLSFTGVILCLNCNKKIKKSYAEGFCYPCSLKLAACDLCILRPETCHYDQGTCREPKWGEENCLRPHYVYLANSSGLKVGITRKTNVPFRWIDQGATEALPILEVKNRLQSGLIEVLFKKLISDKTDWRKMLRGEPGPVNLQDCRDKLISQLSSELKSFDYQLLNENVVSLKYPVECYPDKVSSVNLDKVPEVKGRLLGIKGQYFIFDAGVLNIRSHSGYEVTLEEVHAGT
jgi:hypothetical protein